MRGTMRAWLFPILLLVAVTLCLPALAQPVDINTASPDELEALPGIGPKLAGEIVRERERNGPFASLEDLARVPGISSSIIDKLQGLARAGSGRPPIVLKEGEVIPAEVVEQVLAKYAAEPTVREVQKAALDYARAHPEVVDAWRLRSRVAAAVPEVETDFRVQLDDDRRELRDPDAARAITVIDEDDRGYRFGIGLDWKLDRLIFNREELSAVRESVRLANLRDRVLDEVTRRYYERRRLQVDLELSPPTDLGDRIRKELRVQELTADIDALTGGFFSEKLKDAGRPPY